jgi:hypothetical protein
MVSRARFPVTSIRDPMEVLRQDRLIAARVHELTPHVSARSSTVVADKAERVANAQGLLAQRAASLRISRKESCRHSHPSAKIVAGELPKPDSIAKSSKSCPARQPPNDGWMNSMRSPS